jgi:hypothetical protein
MKNYQEIAGWFDYPNSFQFLVDTIPDGGTFVECGAWLGQSSAYLCDIAKDRINVFIVDSWQGSANEVATHHKLAQETDIYQIFLDNMGERKFTPIRKLSHEAVLDFADESCDVVYIDMEHTYDAVSKDIDMWLPKVKVGGYLAGHDYNPGSWPGVVQAVNEKFHDQFRILDNSTWVHKKEQA